MTMTMTITITIACSLVTNLCSLITIHKNCNIQQKISLYQKNCLIMKKIFALTVCVLACLTGIAQTYAPWDSTQGPLNFNTLSAPYVKCTYRTGSWTGGQDPPEITTPGINQSSGRVSHRLITTNSTDNCRCFGRGDNNTAPYIHMDMLPPDWSMNTQLPPQDTVIMLGCNSCSSGCAVCTDHAQIEYWFYPTVEQNTLLVMFSFAEEDVSNHCALCSGYTTNNPEFYIEVLDGQTNQLIPSEYYKNPNGTVNTNWPHNRFMACPNGNQTASTPQTGPDDYGIFTYYWAHPKATPTTFPFRRCPENQTSGSSSEDVGWFEYKPVAFNLSDYAAQHKSVKLRIRVYGCSAAYHWAYCLFTAKMIPGQIQIDACGNDPIHLSVPSGFIESTYEWHYGYDSVDTKNHPELQIGITPGITGSCYDVTIDRDVLLAAPGGKLWPYYCCKMMSYTGVPFLYEAEIKSYFLEPNITFEQKFENCDLRAQLIDSSRIFTVTPPGYGQTEDDTTYQQTHHIQWFVKNRLSQNFDSIPNHYGDTSFTYVFQHPYIDTLTGEAFIKIVIQDSLQKCIKDTIKRIQLDLKAIRDTLTKDTVYTCEEKLPYVFDRAYFGETHTWATEGTRRVTYDTLAWNGCDSIVDVTLIVRKPKVEITSDPEYCEAFTTNLSVECEDPNDSILLYNWNNGETAPFITITTPGTYSVEIMNQDSCSTSGSIVIPACKPFLNLPNSFSPSKIDGINDYFSIPQSNLIKELEFTVFNRHGVVVYHTTNKDFEWNGTENGKLFVGATYTYTLRIVDYEGVASWHKGAITIL